MPSTKKPDFLRRREEREQEAEERTSAERDRQQRDDNTASINALVEEVRGYRTEQNNTEPKKIRIEQIAAIAAVIAAMLSLGSLIAFIILTSRTDHTAQKAVAVSNSQIAEMRNQRRAWVNIIATNPDNPLIRDRIGLLHFILKATVTNTGLSPARFGLMWAEMFVRGPRPVEMAHIDQACRKIRGRPIDSNAQGITIFPNQSLPQGYAVELSAKDEARLRNAAATGDTLMIAGCFDYLLSEGKDHHQTSFVYEVDRASSVVAGVIVLLTIDPSHDIPVPADKIMLEVNPGLANRAD